jgi:hypothetical protein
VKKRRVGEVPRSNGIRSLKFFYPLNAVQIMLDTDLLKFDPKIKNQCLQLMSLLKKWIRKTKVGIYAKHYRKK